jgi:hypothetical protein
LTRLLFDRGADLEVAYLKDPSDIAKFDLFAFQATEGESNYSSEFPAWWMPENMEVVHVPRESPKLKVFNRVIPNFSLFGINIYSAGVATWEPSLYRFKSKCKPVD